MIDRCKQCGVLSDPFLTKSAAIDLLEAEIIRLNIRVNDLLEANTRYLNRARDAEALVRQSGICAVIK